MPSVQYFKTTIIAWKLKQVGILNTYLYYFTIVLLHIFKICLFYWRNHHSFPLKLTKVFEQLFIIFYTGGVWLILLQDQHKWPVRARPYLLSTWYQLSKISLTYGKPHWSCYRVEQILRKVDKYIEHYIRLPGWCSRVNIMAKISEAEKLRNRQFSYMENYSVMAADK